MVITEIGVRDAEGGPSEAVCDVVGMIELALLAISTTGSEPSSFSILKAENAGYGHSCSPQTSSKKMHSSWVLEKATQPVIALQSEVQSSVVSRFVISSLRRERDDMVVPL